MKMLCGIIVLVSASVAVANNAASLPKDKVTKFVVENLDVTTLPAGIRPKRDHGKKTFSDYGYVATSLDENQAVVATPTGTQISIKILEQKSSEIYVCVTGPDENASNGKIQRVFLLKVKNSGSLLKGRESWKEFDACPVLGGTDHDSTADSYGD
ncbi:MAG TPA: hypothetical protein VGO27_22545 [Candidatus Acidoferrum sp.]|jgi:hypothetical protein|nr:hypothetical protein [Candidatus Acidoferrum sp.]